MQRNWMLGRQEKFLLQSCKAENDGSWRIKLSSGPCVLCRFSQLVIDLPYQFLVTSWKHRVIKSSIVNKQFSFHSSPRSSPKNMQEIVKERRGACMKNFWLAQTTIGLWKRLDLETKVYIVLCTYIDIWRVINWYIYISMCVCLSVYVCIPIKYILSISIANHI